MLFNILDQNKRMGDIVAGLTSKNSALISENEALHLQLQLPLQLSTTAEQDSEQEKKDPEEDDEEQEQEEVTCAHLCYVRTS